MDSEAASSKSSEFLVQRAHFTLALWPFCTLSTARWTEQCRQRSEALRSGLTPATSLVLTPCASFATVFFLKTWEHYCPGLLRFLLSFRLIAPASTLSFHFCIVCFDVLQTAPDFTCPTLHMLVSPQTLLLRFPATCRTDIISWLQ